MATIIALARWLIVKTASVFCENALKIAFLTREQLELNVKKTLISREICGSLPLPLAMLAISYPWLRRLVSGYSAADGSPWGYTL
jgi:hypothetical protein